MHKLLGVLSSNQLWSITNRKGNAIVKLLKNIPLNKSEIIHPGPKGMSVTFSDNSEKAGKIIATIFRDGVAGRTYQMPKADLLKRGAIF